jgi:hypothetical protein
MKESVALAKEADTKKNISSTRSDNSIHRVRNEPDRQLDSLRGVIGNIRRNGGTPSVESIATELSSTHTAQRASVLLALQRTHGNRYVQRVVVGIQAKLKVGQPGDIYEQEADRIAEQVMRMPEPQMHPPSEEEEKKEEDEEEEELLQTKPLAEQITLLVQRQEENEEEEEKEETLQAKGTSGHIFEVNPDLESRIHAQKGGGQPLPTATRAFFEPRFGQDFSPVRVHTGAEATSAAHELNAQAFTIGQDIYFGVDTYSPDTFEGRKLLAHELNHVLQQKGLSVRLQRSPLDRETLERRARSIFDAVEGVGTNERSIFEELQGLTSDDAAELRRIYGRVCSPRRDGRSLTEDLAYEFEDPSNLHRAFRLLGRGVRRQQVEPVEAGRRSGPHIVMNPPVREVVPSTEITYSMDIGEAIYSSVQIRWFVRNDPQAVRIRRQRGHPTQEVVQGPRGGFGTSWEATWDFPGRHTVVCEVQFGNEEPTFYEYVQVVREAPGLAAEAFERQAMALQPDLYVGLLELQLERLRREGAEQNAEQIQQLEEAIQNARRLLEIPEPGHLRTETRAGETGARVVTAEQGPGPARPMRATLVPTARPQPVTLQLFVKPLSGGRWTIVDLTDPSSGRARTYEGGPASSLQGEAAIRSAVQAAWEDFVEDNPHPAGQLVGEPPTGIGFPEGTRWNVHSNGMSDLEEVSQWFSRVGLVAGLGAIVLAIAPVPGSRVVAGLLIVSAAAGATAATLNMADRLEHGNFEWDTETALDLLDLAGSLAVGAGSVVSLSGRALTVTRLRSAVLISEGVDTGSDLAGGVILSALHYSRIQAIRRRTNLTDAQKERMIRSELEQASLQGGLILLGSVGSVRAARGVQIDRRRIQDILENSDIPDALRRDVGRSQSLQRFLMDPEYDIDTLRRLWDDWQLGTGRLASTDFTQYVGRRGYRTGTRDNPRLTEVFGGNFDTLNIREKNLRILETSEPRLARALSDGSLPTQVQRRINELLNQDIIGSQIRLRSAREAVTRQINETLGRSAADITEFRRIVSIIEQPGSRGSIGEYFFAQHAAGARTGAAEFRQPRFSSDEVPGLTVESFSPDRIRPNSRRTLDVKVGYTTTDIDVQQMRNYDRLIDSSQRSGSRLQQRLQEDFGITGGLREHDYLFLPRGDVSARDAAERAYGVIRREGFLARMNVFYLDDSGIIWKYRGPNTEPQSIGSQLPD